MPSNDVLCGINTEPENLNSAIERFWKIEEIDTPVKLLSTAEKRCEAHFHETVQRDHEGRFIVRLPFSDNSTCLGDSKDIAYRRFMSLEKRLTKNQELKIQYSNFLDEYLNLGHMEPVDIRTLQAPIYFLPHHCVMKLDSSTTKLRVVFDASAKTSSNISLNDILHTGPTVQDELFAILLRFRIRRFVFTADIEKMYRQVLIHKDDRKYQIILWRNKPEDTLKCYQLRTVTYGMSAAPYLATKCLQRLAEDEQDKYPLGSQILLRDFYVDDVMTGFDSMLAATQAQQELLLLLQSAGFNLRKWCANHPKLLDNIKPEDQEVQLDFTDQKEQTIKALGLTWLPKTDNFCIKAKWPELKEITKRSIASDIARLFDPLGIASPIVITAKIFLQQLWHLKLDWDSKLPAEMSRNWLRYREELQLVNDMQFPRHVFANETTPKAIQLHTFADASERAYGAVTYLRSINKDNKIIVRLLCAKSRVAPLQKLSVERLELCAAKVAAELATRIQRDIKIEKLTTHFWSDSEIVLNWIKSESTSFHTFVANRISAIQQLTVPAHWHHVPSEHNPADLLSRGIPATKFQSSNLWFYGPSFLHGDESIWPPPFINKMPVQTERKRKVPTTTLVITDNDDLHWLEKIRHGGSFRKLQRVTAYILRYARNLRIKYHQPRQSSRPIAKLAKPTSLTTKELEESLCLIVKFVQGSQFAKDIDHLTRFKEPPKNSDVCSLTPFLDDKGIMRVGGRLQASSLSYDAKHPMLLPYGHPFTSILLHDLHKENHHIGPQGLLAITRQRYWPIKGKTIARSVVQRCVRCTRTKPKMYSQIMGNLPRDRIEPARPFVNTGVDYCGPIWVHYHTRGKRPQKAYLAIFCCFSTKAVHLEVVSDLSTDAFLGALKRFTGRRGHCKKIYSDNATNFVGAKNKLEELEQSIFSDDARKIIANSCSSKGIQFCFIPPRAPHFGGLWEAAVKSAKNLLQRSLADANLSYEELETAVIEIEAILNSRPLTPMSSDPNDLSALTPGHFLIGEPIISIIDPLAQPQKSKLLTRWKLVAHIKNEFWRRWSLEYLNELQCRTKWKHQGTIPTPGTLVIMKEDNLPATKWPLARIVNTYKGDDGLVRVADVRTTSGILKRPIHKLAPLFGEEDINPPQTTLLANVPPSTASKDRKPTQEDERPAKRSRPTTYSSLMILLVIGLCFPNAQAAASAHFQTFKAQLGMQFDNVGDLDLITSEWDIVVYYNLKPYWLEFQTLKLGTEALHRLCEKMKPNNDCTETIKQFEHSKEELTIQNEILTSTKHRTRRGAINIIGNVANSLFGVLDSEYAQHMALWIEAIRKNENNLQILLKNHTSVIDSTINIMKRDQIAVQKKFNAMEAQISNIVAHITSTNRELYETRIAEMFTSLCIQLTLLLTNLQRAQRDITDSIMDTHHGRLTPALITPEQLKQELHNMKGHLPQSLRIPADLDNILNIYKLLSVRARIVNDYAIFQLKLPLATAETYELYKLIPLPAKFNESWLTIHPTSALLAINSQHEQYYPMTEQDLADCMNLTPSRFQCKQSRPVNNKGNPSNECEIKLFTHFTISDTCHIKVLNEESTWTQMTHNPNQWIFALKHKTHVNVVCKGTVQVMLVEGTGIMKIPAGCIAKDNLVTIHGHNIFSSEIRSSYTRLGLHYNETISEKLISISNGTVPYETHVKQLQNLEDKVESLKSTEMSMDAPPHLVHQFTISYIGLLLAVVVIIYLIYKHTDKMTILCRRKKRTPTPAPRHSPPTSDFTVHI